MTMIAEPIAMPVLPGRTAPRDRPDRMRAAFAPAERAVGEVGDLCDRDGQTAPRHRDGRDLLPTGSGLYCLAKFCG